MTDAQPCRTVFLIDGFNFYHSIKKLAPRLHWFDYRHYCQHFLSNNDSLRQIIYFTALAKWIPDAAQRHQVLIEALINSGIEVVAGSFKRKDRRCPNCHQTYTSHEEKATDVNIALSAYKAAACYDVDKIIIVSGDTDLIPAINHIRHDFPHKPIGVVFPLERISKQMRKAACFSHKTSKEILFTCQLPDQITLPSGKVIRRPNAWL